jgi:hypothetical protein
MNNQGQQRVLPLEEILPNEVAQEDQQANDLDIIDIIDLGNMGDDEANQQARNQPRVGAQG